jgi:hypothetical protein
MAGPLPNETVAAKSKLEPAEPQLASVHFMPGIAVMVGGKWSALTFWSREKHFDEVRDDGQRIRCEQLKNGDIRISTADGRYRDVYPWAIACRVYEPARAK